MHPLRNILFKKYWIPDEMGAFYSTTETTSRNGMEQKILAMKIHNLKSRVRKLPPSETLSPREVLELIAPFYAYELEVRFALSERAESRSFDLRRGEWQYGLEYEHNFLSLDARLSWKEEGYLSLVVAVSPDFREYSLLESTAHHYSKEVLRLSEASLSQIERFSTRIPTES